MKLAPEPIGYCTYISKTKLAACSKSMPGCFPVYSAQTISELMAKISSLEKDLAKRP